MLPYLGDARRRSLQRLSLMFCSLALATLPLTSPYSHEASAHEGTVFSSPPIVHSSPLTFPEIAPGRDPFLPDAAYRLAASAPPAAGRDNGGTSVRAVVTGTQPLALIETGGAVNVVGVGDRIGSTLVIGIDAHGVTLEGGVTLPLAQANP